MYTHIVMAFQVDGYHMPQDVNPNPEKMTLLSDESI